jgi:hypothetical protein
MPGEEDSGTMGSNPDHEYLTVKTQKAKNKIAIDKIQMTINIQYQIIEIN